MLGTQLPELIKSTCSGFPDAARTPFYSFEGTQVAVQMRAPRHPTSLGVSAPTGTAPAHLSACSMPSVSTIDMHVESIPARAKGGTGSHGGWFHDTTTVLLRWTAQGLTAVFSLRFRCSATRPTHSPRYSNKLCSTSFLAAGFWGGTLAIAVWHSAQCGIF